MRAIVLILILTGLAACDNPGPEGFLEPCNLAEDCPTAGMQCAQVQNNFTGLLTDARYCTTRCTTDRECPTLDCATWEGTDLECAQTAQSGGRCGNGAIGELRLMVCGM